MLLHRSVENLPLFRNAVITIGTFDGVHAGHKKIIDALKEEAQKINGESVIISFHPHPRIILQPEQLLQLINSLEEKIELISHTGIDHLVIVPFTPAFADLSARAYMEDFLVSKFQPHSIIIGYDHHFGKGREGNFQLLEANAERLRYKLIEISGHVLNEIAVSSTKIRKALAAGQVETANALLGYLYFFEGLVIKGDQLGRKLGYPTANLQYKDPDKILLSHGVYAVYVHFSGNRYKGLLSIGTRPTLKNSELRVEVHLFDFDKDIYGKELRVEVKHLLRPQEKFEDLDQLMKQMDADKAKSLELL
jgi:riboflavin kinase/FMN adenylyltransferase